MQQLRVEENEHISDFWWRMFEETLTKILHCNTFHFLQYALLSPALDDKMLPVISIYCFIIYNLFD